jgi:peptide deformylase
MRVHTYPDPVLLRQAPIQAAFDDELRQRIAEMFTVMYEEGGVGLAAPQVGWSTQVLVLNPTGQRDEDEGAMVVINPRILKRWGKTTDQEGCLSFPEIYVDVERSAGVRLAWHDEHGVEHEEDLNDYTARIVQHEMDHLEGVLLVHRMSPVDRIRWRRELEDLVAGEVAG